MRDELYNRELNWFELITKAFRVFSANLSDILRIMTVIFLPLSILQSMILERMTANSAVLSAFIQAGDALANRPDVMNALAHTVMNEVLYFAVVLFLEPVGIIAIAKLTKQRINGEELSGRKALAEALAMEPAILVSGVIYGVLVFLGGLLIIPGIYLSVAWCLYLYCIGLGDRTGWDSLRRSKELVKGKWWITCLYYYALTIITFLWNSVFELIYVIGEPNPAKDILYYFLCYFSGAFLATGMALLFLNREAMAGGMRLTGPDFIDGQAEEKREE